MGWLQFTQDYADAIQTHLMLVAAICAIVWWSVRGERMPRANLELTIDHFPLGDDGHLIRVVLHVHNVGQVIVRLADVDIHLHQILPVPYEAKRGFPVPFDFRKNEGATEFNWPALASQSVKFSDQPEFEPGESGPLPFEFRVMDLPKVVSVYVHARNIAKNPRLRRWKGRSPDIGWCVSKIITLSHEPTTDNPASPPQSVT